MASSIEWTDETWNPTVGCNKISPGCKHCLAPDTPVLMGDMSWKPIGEIRVGEAVVSFTESPSLGQNRLYEAATVEAVWGTEKEAVEITVGGRVIIASKEHLFLAHARPYWRQAHRLSLRSRLVDIGMPEWTPDISSRLYLMGYIAGLIGGDGTMRVAGSGKNGTKQSYMRVAMMESDKPALERFRAALHEIGCENIHLRPFNSGQGRPESAWRGAEPQPMLKVETRRRANLLKIKDAMVERDDHEWSAGFLAGFMDSDGSYSGKNLRFHQKKSELLDVTHRAVHRLGFVSQREDFRSSAGRSERLVGNTEDKIRFLATIRPALTRKATEFYGKRFPGKTAVPIDGIRRVGVRRLVDIQTSSGTFIAAGIATHNCYAEVMHRRLTAMGVAKYQEPFNAPRPWRDHLELPLSWSAPRMVFVNSMSDLFHDRMPVDYIQEVFDVMRRCPQHTFQVLTKRSERLVALADELPWPSNVWMGVSVETADYVHRAEHLAATPAKVRFLSVEPLLGPIPDLPLDNIHWVIVGGESGHKARPMEPEWAREIRDQCIQADVAFFLKQLGGRRGKRGGDEATLDGQLWRQFPRAS